MALGDINGPVGRRRRRRIIPVVGCLAAALMLAACGGEDESTSTNTSPAASGTSTTLTTNANTDAVDDFRQALISRGFTPEQADCTADKVLAEIGRPRFEELYSQGTPPPEVEKIVFSAGAACAPGGPGK